MFRSVTWPYLYQVLSILYLSFMLSFLSERKANKVSYYPDEKCCPETSSCVTASSEIRLKNIGKVEGDNDVSSD